MKKIEQFQITSMNISGFKSYEEPTEFIFGNPTVITGGNGRGKTSIADAIAFAVTGLPFFGERGIDRLHNENNPDATVQMCFVDEAGVAHELTRVRRKNRMTITYDGYEIRQLDLADLFGERDVFLSILNPLYFIEELGENGKNLLERYLPLIPQETILAQLPEPVRESLKDEEILSPDAYLKRRREEIRGLEEHITYLGGQKDLAAAQGQQHEKMQAELAENLAVLRAEIAALEEKQFDGLDPVKTQERLVELSHRYEEIARDERGDTMQKQKELHTLREKIIRRQAEQYQSKFTEPLAEITSKVNDLGMRTDVLDGCLKAAGMLMLLRSMAPDVVAVDELGDREDTAALEQVLKCGCSVLATIHGGSYEELSRKRFLQPLLQAGAFQRYLVLKHCDGTFFVEQVRDGDGRLLASGLACCA